MSKLQKYSKKIIIFINNHALIGLFSSCMHVLCLCTRIVFMAALQASISSSADWASSNCCSSCLLRCWALRSLSFSSSRYCWSWIALLQKKSTKRCTNCQKERGHFYSISILLHFVLALTDVVDLWELKIHPQTAQTCRNNDRRKASQLILTVPTPNIKSSRSELKT